MKRYILLLSVLTATGLNAQENQKAIQQWQSLHPTTLLISEEHYNDLSATQRQLLGKDVIIFQGTITMAQLNAYDAEKSSESGKPAASKTEDLDAIKIWLAQHPEVRIIPQSKYAMLMETRLQDAHSPACIILEGEVLTRKDIDNYTALYGQ
jgi:hypothetical protein